MERKAKFVTKRAIIHHTAMEYGDYFIQSSPYGYTVIEKRYSRGGNFEPFVHCHRHNGQYMYFSTIKSAMEYCDRQETYQGQGVYHE